MKKVILITMILIILTTLAIVCTPQTKDVQEDKEETQEETLTDKELDDMQYVDDKIDKLLNSDKYDALSLDERAIEVKKVLKELKKEKYIKNYYYEEGSYLFSFEYSCGVLGGVMIKEFDPMLNKG